MKNKPVKKKTLPPLGLVIHLFVGAVLLLPTVVWGQTAASTKAPQLSKNNYPVSVTVKPELRQELEGKRVDLALLAEESKGALLELLNASDYSYEFDPAFYEGMIPTLDLPPRQVTMKLVKVPLPKALDSLTKVLGIGWTAEKDGDAITLKIVRLRDTVTMSDMVSGGFGQSMMGGMTTGINTLSTNLRGTGGGIGGGGMGGGLGGQTRLSAPAQNNSPLIAASPVRIKIDLKDRSVRDALKEILTAAKLEYAIDDDVAADLKRSFVFENVRLMTALNAVCESAGIGWRVENIPTSLLVRISKRYAAPSGSADASDALHSHFSIGGSFEPAPF
jgi:hypothetical protein